MMKAGTKKKILTNIGIIIAGFFLAVVLFYFTENPDLFSASIISLRDKQLMEQNNWNIGYKNQGNVLDVFVSDKLENISNLTVSIIYDQENARIDPSKILAQNVLSSEILSNEPGKLVVKFFNFSGGFDYESSLFEMPFLASSDIYNVLISEATVLGVDGGVQPLSIGLLNDVTDADHGI